MHWTPELQSRFVNAVQHLGINTAVPKAILALINVDGVSRENVASHLQKFKEQVRRRAGLNAVEPFPDDVLERTGMLQQTAVAHAAVEAAETLAVPRLAQPQRAEADGGACGAAYYGGGAGYAEGPVTAEELNNLVHSDAFVRSFLPGAGTTALSGEALQAFVLGDCDELQQQQREPAPQQDGGDARRALREPRT